MRALRFHAAGRIEVDDVPEPGDPSGDEVVVRPLLCGICGTDLHEFTSGPIVIPTEPHPLTGAAAPQILGHEFGAEVVALGPRADGLAVGDRCAVMPLISCGRCRACVRGLNHLCAEMACTGLSDAWGGLGELATLRRSQLVPLPAGLTPAQAAIVEPAAVAAYGVDRGRLEPGGTVLVTGAGPIGSLAVLYALQSGASRVVLVESDAARVALAGSLGEGLGDVLVVTPAEVAEAVHEATSGWGVDLAVECAGNEAALNACIDAVRPAGTVVQTALHTRPAAISAQRLAFRDLTLVGTWCYPVYDFPRIATLIAGGRLPVERIVTSQVPVEQAVSDGFERLVAPGGGEVKVLVELA